MTNEKLEMRAQAHERQTMGLCYPNWISKRNSNLLKKERKQNVGKMLTKNLVKIKFNNIIVYLIAFGCRRTGSISLNLLLTTREQKPTDICTV